VIGVPAAIIGLIGVCVGVVTIRASGRGSANWWIGVAAAALGAYPAAALTFYLVAAFMGWGDYGR
jgi:hypothetical protein